ncbi:MAG: FKBP-type peptidyl-prolyl cis-trans isomerase [Woeseiaceae bacterium]|nr:FKBP-type peptidyl-prolyl cis-trans isomerase [Woeseiaceae bacterium]
MTDTTASEGFQIAPGLSARILHNGYGRAAEAGDYVEVHYTGWFHDETSGDGRGDKFDSSVDRRQRFNFTLGANEVIKGWDQGVAGMLIGEKRELTIAPELAYGERGYPGAIPPNSTLIFEVELFGAEAPGREATE